MSVFSSLGGKTEVYSKTNIQNFEELRYSFLTIYLEAITSVVMIRWGDNVK